MGEGEPTGMERLALDDLARFPVLAVSKEREALVGELNPDLIAASRLKACLDERVTMKALDHPPVCDCSFSFLPPASDEDPQRSLVLEELVSERAFIFTGRTVGDQLVTPVDGVILELRAQTLCSFVGTGENEDAAGVAIQAMNDVNLRILEAALAEVLCHRLDQGRQRVSRFGWDRQQAGWFVDDHDVPILDHHLEETGIAVATGNAKGPGVHVDSDLIADLEAVTEVVGDDAVDLDGTAIDQVARTAIGDLHASADLRLESLPLRIGFPAVGRVQRSTPSSMGRFSTDGVILAREPFRAQGVATSSAMVPGILFPRGGREADLFLGQWAFPGWSGYRRLMMKLNVKAFAIAMALVWGFGVFVGTWWIIVFSGAEPGETLIIGKFYFGYDVTPKGSFIGLAWALADGLIGGAIVAWLYNQLAGKFSSSSGG